MPQAYVPFQIICNITAGAVCSWHTCCFNGAARNSTEGHHESRHKRTNKTTCRILQNFDFYKQNSKYS